MDAKKTQLLSRFKRGISQLVAKDDTQNGNNDNKSPISLSNQKPITLTLNSDNLYHNSTIIAEGCPDPKELPCVIRWYNDNLIEIYSSTKSLKFQPNVQDAQHKIFCQWFPTDEGDDTSVLLPSKLAEIGPLKKNPALIQDAQAILDKGKGEFDIILPQISKTEKQKLVIEGTKIHVYINTKSYDKTKPLKSSKSKIYSNTSEASDELKSDDAKLSGEFEDSVVDVTMTRFLYSLDEINENEEQQEEQEEDNDDDGNIWMQTYRIKPEYKVTLSRRNVLEFYIENGKGSLMLKALAATVRERDILAIVIQALADAKRKRKQKKKRSQDLVELRIDVIDDSRDNGRKSWKEQKLEQQNEIRELKLKITTIHDKMLEIQKVGSEKEKYITDLNRLKEAGLLKRDEINKLSQENMKYSEKEETMNDKIKELNEEIEELKIEKEKRDREIKEAQNENEEKISEQLQLENEIEALTKKLELKDSKIAEYEMEIANLEDDRSQLKLSLNHLNSHVGKVQDDKSQMDQDFSTLNEEMIKYKKESRQWKSEFNTKSSQFDTLQIDYDNLKKQLNIEQEETEKKKVDIKQNELEIQQLNEQIKQMNQIKKEYKDIQFEIAGKDEQIQRLKHENEGLREDLKEENEKSVKHEKKIKKLTKSLDKATTKNAKLQSQIDEFEDRVTDSVARPLYNELQRELEDYKDKLNDIIKDRDNSKVEILKLKELNTNFKQMVDKLTTQNESYKDEMNQLQTHNTFWKNKVKSMREEIKKLHSMPVQPPQPQQPQQVQSLSPSDYDHNINNGHHHHHHHNQRHKLYPKSDNDVDRHSSDDIDIEKSKLVKKLKKIEKEKHEALAVVDQLKKALNNELQKASSQSMKNKILNSHTNEEVSTLIRKNNALKLLANELSDTVADKEQNLMHLKKVAKLLGNRVTVLEKENKTLRLSVNEVDVLNNTHSLPSEAIPIIAPPPNDNNNSNQQQMPTIIVSKKRNDK